MYDELVNSLRICGKMRSADDYCVAFHDGCCEAEPVCMYELMMKAAEAIEELNGFVQEAERDRDEYRERLDKANDVIEKLQKRVPKRPHGRLIDADEFFKDICNSLNEMTAIGIAVDVEWMWGKLNDALENAPTVIEAEEGE